MEPGHVLVRFRCGAEGGQCGREIGFVVSDGCREWVTFALTREVSASVEERSLRREELPDGWDSSLLSMRAEDIVARCPKHGPRVPHDRILIELQEALQRARSGAPPQSIRWGST